MAWTLVLRAKPQACHLLQARFPNKSYPVSQVTLVSELQQEIVSRAYANGTTGVTEFTHMWFSLQPLAHVISVAKWFRFKCYHHMWNEPQPSGWMTAWGASDQLANIRPGYSVADEAYRVVSTYKTPGTIFPQPYGSQIIGRLFRASNAYFNYSQYPNADFPAEVLPEKSMCIVSSGTLNSERRVLLPRFESVSGGETFSQTFRDKQIGFWELVEPQSFFLGIDYSRWNSGTQANPHLVGLRDVELLFNFEETAFNNLPDPLPLPAVSGKLTDQFEDAILKYLAFGDMTDLTSFVPLGIFWLAGRWPMPESGALPTILSQASISMSVDRNVASAVVLPSSIPQDTASGFAIVGQNGLPAVYGELVKPMVAKAMQRGSVMFRLELSGSYLSKLGSFSVMAFLSSGGSILTTASRSLGAYSGDPRYGGTKVASLSSFTSSMMQKLSNTMYVNNEDLVFDRGANANSTNVVTHIAIETGDSNAPLVVMPIKEPVVVRKGMGLVVRTGGLILTVG